VVRYLLWQIVVIKLLLMPFWTLYVPLPGWFYTASAQPAVSQPAEKPRDALPGPPMHGAFPIPRGIAGGQTVPAGHPFWEPFTEVSWQTWLLVLWLLVVVGQVTRLLVQRWRLGNLLHQAVPADGGITDLVAELAAEIGLRQVPATVSVGTNCPLFVCGLWQPRLVLPSRLIASLGPAERRQVLLHELAHVKRHDLVWGWPVEIARIVYFFHPLVRWVVYRLRLERELCCDQLAMARSGHSAAEYAQTLVHVVSHASEPAVLQAAAIAAGLAGGQSPPKTV
jgi:beta-lactamase regulating signal transducer with metallopeptidase domain